MEKLQKPWFNMLLTLGISLLCMIIYINSGVLEDVGMVALFLNWIPVLIGFASLIMYWILYIFLKDRSSLATIIGGAINILWVVIALFH